VSYDLFPSIPPGRAAVGQQNWRPLRYLPRLASQVNCNGGNHQEQGEVKTADDRVAEVVVPSVQKERRSDRDQEDRDELDPRNRMRWFPSLPPSASADQDLRPDGPEQQRPEADDHAETHDGERAHVGLA
jgi:hypothetical protein